MILLKKINIENWFSVGLYAIYLLKSALHLKYEKITVINNMQLLHYIDTVAIRTGPAHRRVFAMTYGIKSLLEISKSLEISDQQISMKAQVSSTTVPF